jgi:hypothetical protein
MEACVHIQVLKNGPPTSDASQRAIFLSKDEVAEAFDRLRDFKIILAVEINF